MTHLQDIKFCRSADGVGIAYAVHGSGPPLLIDSCWLSHLQFDWQSPVWRHFLVELGKIATVIRFDERGHGLSDRDVTDHSLEMRVADLEAVADHAGLDRFAMFAMAQGGPISIEYAARHPERLSRLIVYGSYAGAMSNATPEEIAHGRGVPGADQGGLGAPDAGVPAGVHLADDPGRHRGADAAGSTSCSGWRPPRTRPSWPGSSASWPTSGTCCRELDLPTLVIHSRGDRMNNFEEARYLAAHIRGARLVALESKNHIVLEDEPAWPVLLGGGDRVPGRGPGRRAAAGRRPRTRRALLSARELDVLTLAAEGCDNDAIAARLSLSVRTVERHLQNVYAKLGLQGRSARTAAVAALLSRA